MRKLFCIFIFLSAFSAWATTYYLSPSGSDSYTTEQAQNEGTPWKTFGKAFGEMSAEDELILLDGVYSEAAGTGYISYLGTGSEQAPSGTNKSAMTIVRAKNAGNVTVDGGSNAGLFVGRSTRKDSYIKFQGITFEGGGSLYNTSYIYIKNCGFHSTDKSADAVFGIGTNDHENGNTYNLIEDCWIWGQERIIAVNYRANNNIWRRVVIRGDGCDSASCTGSGNPNVGISVYESQDVSLQNVVVVDRILGGGEPYGDFSTAQHTADVDYYLGPAEWLGCISLKAPDTGFYFEADYANDNTINLTNCVAWDSAVMGFNIVSPASNKIRNVTLNHLTAGANDSYDTFRLSDVDTGIVKNLISYSAPRYGVNTVDSDIVPSYCDVYNAGTAAYYNNSCSSGCKTTDPTSDGTPVSLKYLPRIEDGSVLKGTGDGGDYGANIFKRYGTDGTFHGDSGYNTLSSTDLWPWPNEDRIKDEMDDDSIRGFCAPGESLTHYIWNYLGNGGYPGDDAEPGYASDLLMILTQLLMIPVIQILLTIGGAGWLYAVAKIANRIF